ncbi:MAG: HEPN domain-containing protein [Proteobacteria bacterium]|nr:HEPN domain-containing protein [Pseudomonadota bacterium]
MDEEHHLVDVARQSLAAAQVLLQNGFPEFAAGRAYYSMFYLATAVLLRRGQRHKRHASLHAAFG